MACSISGCIPPVFLFLLGFKQSSLSSSLRLQLRGVEKLHSNGVSVKRGGAARRRLSPLCFKAAIHCIFSERDKPDNGIRLGELEYEDDINMVDQTAEEASSRLTP